MWRNKLPLFRGTPPALTFRTEPLTRYVSPHEVRSQPDKLALVREALRVVKPGGVFVFQDIFYSQKVYGDLEQFLSQLKGDVAELRFVDSRRVKGIPRIVGTRFVLGNAGLIYGKK